MLIIILKKKTIVLWLNSSVAIFRFRKKSLFNGSVIILRCASFISLVGHLEFRNGLSVFSDCFRCDCEVRSRRKRSLALSIIPSVNNLEVFHNKVGRKKQTNVVFEISTFLTVSADLFPFGFTRDDSLNDLIWNSWFLFAGERGWIEKIARDCCWGLCDLIRA